MAIDDVTFSWEDGRGVTFGESLRRTVIPYAHNQKQLHAQITTRATLEQVAEKETAD